MHDGLLHVAPPAPGRHVTGPHRYDDSLTRVLTVSLDELGAANGLLASAIVDSEDVSFDGRTDVREFLRPKESQTLTFNLRLNRVDGTESLDDILQWTMVLRLRYGSPTSSAATRRSGRQGKRRPTTGGTRPKPSSRSW
mgnify:CR=1 FL=1